MKELNHNLFSMVQDVKDKPLDLPTTGFIIVGGTIVLIILGAFVLGKYDNKLKERSEERDEWYPELHIQVKNTYWQNKHLDTKELYTWMWIHKIPRPARVLFITFQNIPFLRNISIHSICNVQKVDYLLCIHLPRTPPDLAYTTSREGLKYFAIPADEDMVEEIIDTLHNIQVQRSKMLSYDRNWAVCYKNKLQTIYMYENSSYRPSNLC